MGLSPCIIRLAPVFCTSSSSGSGSIRAIRPPLYVPKHILSSTYETIASKHSFFYPFCLPGSQNVSHPVQEVCIEFFTHHIANIWLSDIFFYKTSSIVKEFLLKVYTSPFFNPFNTWNKGTRGEITKTSLSSS